MKSAYYKLDPASIVENILHEGKTRRVKIKDLNFVIHPHVFPSDQFRSSKFLIESIQDMCLGASVCDMGCGFGLIGCFALKYGAKKVVQADINQFAVENALKNKKMHKFSNKQMQVYQSDCFDDIPPQKFDLVVFNIPFHDDRVEIHDPLQYAFFDPAFQTVRKFLIQLHRYSYPDTETIIAFSNKGNTRLLEHLFDEFGYKWTLWKVAHTDQQFDSRLYLLRN